MIGHLKGKISYIDPSLVTIDVNGVGYDVRISLNTYSSIKEEEQIMLLTHLYVNANDMIPTLFGFRERSEKKLFLDLISVSGIGPSVALTMLSSLDALEIKQGIVNENVKLIQGIKGIGPKTAQRAILELKDKFKKEGLIEESEKTGGIGNNTMKNEALSALVMLGIAKPTAEKSLETILKKTSGDITLEELIKLALRTA
jgi:holliday junction DNA helicase RuvA